MDRFEDITTLLGVLGDWTAGAGPLYRRLAAALGRAVAHGELPPGVRLPSERALAAALSVSRATVVGAYDELRGTGVLASRRGSGTRVSPRAGRDRPVPDGRVPGGGATAMVQRLVDGTGEVISLVRAVDAAPAALTDTMRDLAAEDLPGLFSGLGYHPAGLPALRAALAADLTRRGVRTDPDEVLVTTGAHQAIVLAAQLYLRRGDTVLVESPTWSGCVDVFRAAGARLLPVPLDEEGVAAGPLARALAGRRPALMYLMPTYHNPTGTLMSASRRRRVVELAARHRVPVLEDNAYSGEIAGTPAPPPLAALAPPGADLLSVDSLAKTVWGGLRIGWVRAARPVIGRLARLKAMADLGSPVLDQAVAARLLPRLPEIAAERAATLADRLARLERLLAEHLPEWRWRRPAGGSALWIELPGADAERYAQLALRHGLEVAAGAATDPDGAYRSHIRVPFTFPPDVLDEVVARLHRAWRDLRRHDAAPPAG